MKKQSPKKSGRSASMEALSMHEMCMLPIYNTNIHVYAWDVDVEIAQTIRTFSTYEHLIIKHVCVLCNEWTANKERYI